MGATVATSEAPLTGWIEFRNKYNVGDVDPFNGQKVTKDERKAAWNGMELFSYVVKNKKAEIAAFMITNYGNTMKPGKENEREFYYKKFLDTYMQKDANGNWTRKLNMWTKDAKGNWTPNKPKEKKP
jgi:hypothetical protein